jgi:hypothetical protein
VKYNKLAALCKACRQYMRNVPAIMST